MSPLDGLDVKSWASLLVNLEFGLVGDLMTKLGLLFSLCVLVSKICLDKGILIAKAVSSKMWKVVAFLFRLVDGDG